MAAIALDPLEYTHQLEASGVPREQAEVHARAMTATFLHNFDALVTRDYLDTRFTEFETRIEAGIDKRFVGLDKRFVGLDKGFVGLDKRFVDLEATMDRRFDEVDKRFIALETCMDKRFLEMEASMDKRFLEMETGVDKSFAKMGTFMAQQFTDSRLEMHGKVAGVREDLGKLTGKFNVMQWMMALLIAGVFLPMLRSAFF